MAARRSTVARALFALVGLAAIGALAVGLMRRGGPPDGPTVKVVRGDYVEFVEIRGDVRPYKSVVISAPMQSGDLQILKLLPNGTQVKKGDIVIVFDESTIRRQILDRQSELRQTLAELDQYKAQQHNSAEQDQTALMHAGYDVDRARLGLGDPRVTAPVDLERGKLTLSDSQQKLKEVQTTDRAHRTSAVADVETRQRRIEKMQAEIARIEASIDALQVKAPSDGTVNLMMNYRAMSPMGAMQEFRAGDRAYPGAQIVELPDLSSVHMAARIDESDRGRLQLAQPAKVRVDAIADRQFDATVADISLLARVDFSSWPPTKNFDIKIGFRDGDARLRPGMSATARIEVGRMPEMLLVPANAVFLVDGRAVVFKLDGRTYGEVPVTIVKRNREQAAITGVSAGDILALFRPDQTRTAAAK